MLLLNERQVKLLVALSKLRGFHHLSLSEMIDDDILTLLTHGLARRIANSIVITDEGRAWLVQHNQG